MKNLGLLCLALLFACGLVGPGYAWWSDSVAVNKRLESGVFELGVRVSDDCRTDTSRDKRGKKDESGDQIELAESPYIFKLDGSKYAGSVNVSVYGSPSFFPEYTIEIANGGSIPAQLDEFLIDWEGDIADGARVKKWSVTSPQGVKEKGEGYTALKDFIKSMIIDPEQIISIEMMLSFKQTGSLEGEILVNGSQWNGAVWKPRK